MLKCKLCFRKFLSGRAIGVHMARSHFTKLPLPHKIFQENKESINVQLGELTESTSTEIEEKGVSYVLRENPRKSSKVIDPPEFAESTREKRMMEEDEFVKSESTELSGVASDEDIALLLLMLSRGELKLGEKQCKKGLKSSQALGSLKKQRNSSNKAHECSHCGRIFGSGQALGGHIRSHFTRRTTTITTVSCPSNVEETLMGFSNGLIDLNLPPPMDYDYDDGF